MPRLRSNAGARLAHALLGLEWRACHNPAVNIDWRSVFSLHTRCARARCSLVSVGPISPLLCTNRKFSLCGERTCPHRIQPFQFRYAPDESHPCRHLESSDRASLGHARFTLVPKNSDGQALAHTHQINNAAWTAEYIRISGLAIAIAGDSGMPAAWWAAMWDANTCRSVSEHCWQTFY